MRSSTNKTEISLSNVAVTATTNTSVSTKGNASLKGIYTATDITNEQQNFVLKDNVIYKVGTGGASVSPYRAYIQITGAAPSRLMFFVDDEPTSIEGLAPTESIKNDILFNLQGQRVSKAGKGLFVRQDGKKVVIR